jgi:Zn-dependent protease
VKIAKIKGIEIKLHLSTLFIIALVGFYATSFYAGVIPNAPLFELIIVGVINGLIILVSILIHELSHSLVAQRFGLNVTEIELYLFGGVSKIEEEPRTPKSEVLIAIVGPLSSLLIGGFMVFMFFLPISLPAFLSVTLFYSGISNIGLGIFNLLPAFPIDGGRVLRAFLWGRRKNIISATKTASKVGVVFGYGLMIFGVFQIFTSGLINGIWLIIMGSFLRSTAKQSYMQTLNEFTLSNISVNEILYIPQPNLEIPFDVLISDAIREYFIPYKRSYFPVIKGETIVGIVHIEDIKKIPLERRSQFIIGYAMRKISEFPEIRDDETGKDAMKKLNKSDTSPHIIVVRGKDSDELIGFIGKEELVSALRYWSLNTHKS